MNDIQMGDRVTWVSPRGPRLHGKVVKIIDSYYAHVHFSLGGRRVIPIHELTKVIE